MKPQVEYDFQLSSILGTLSEEDRLFEAESKSTHVKFYIGESRTDQAVPELMRLMAEMPLIRKTLLLNSCWD